MRHPGGLGALVEADGAGCFVRCLLPVALSGGTELVVGTWVRVGEAEFGAVQGSWESAGYDGLAFGGALGNAIPPWGEELLDAPVVVAVRDRDEVPYVTGSDRADVAGLLATTWDRDHVLSRYGHPLPVAVRTLVGGGRWSIERSAGLAAAGTGGGGHCFSGPGRTVTAEEAAGPGAVPHAGWTAVVRGGRERYEFRGVDVLPGGAGLSVVCTVDDRADLAWAGHVWRSLSAV
ncbi:DUF2199 domain-containing protein [Streptomyces sp. NBC_00433]